jgi:hypothetical protein
VIMAVVTTYMAAPVLRYLIRGTEMQADFEISPFMQDRSSKLRERAIGRAASAN